MYQKYGFISPFINIDSYRPLTKKLFVKRKSSELRNIIRYIKSLYYISYRRKALNNINYVQTVLDEEFNILKANPLLSHVERFFAPSVKVPTNFTIKKNSGFILIGNSANPTINHIDVLESLCRININNKRIIIPISYGDAAYKTFLKTQIQNHSYSFKIIFLEDFLPIKEYDNIFNNVSHAIFGVIRQKAIGNIRLCLTHGVKVFLYKNSIPYIDFKKHGYIIYSIEDDLTLEALNSPLSEHDAVYNFNLWAKYNRENQIRAIEVANSLCKKISDSHK